MAGAAMLVQEVAVPAGTARSSVLTLISSAVGAGVLSFPFALRCTGWAAGLLCVFAIAATEAFTLFVLSKLAEHTGARSYSALVHQMLGPAGSLLMTAVVLAYCFGSCIAYLIIVGDSFRPLLLEAFGATWWTSRTATICGIGCAIILPLSFKTRLGALKAVSGLCFWGLLTVTAIVAVRSAEIISSPDYTWDPVRAFNPSLSFLTALPIIVFGFQCHTNVISVWEELEPRPTFFRSASRPAALEQSAAPAAAAAAAAAPSSTAEQQAEQGSQPPLSNGQRRPKSEKLVGMAHVVMLAVGVTAVLYSCVGLAGYLAFPDSVVSNVMLNFSAKDPLIQVARAMVGVIQIAAYPLNHFPARGAIRDLLQHTTGRAPSGSGFVAVETLLFYSATLGLALWCEDLGDIFKLVGGTCGSVLILAMPGALLVQYSRSKQLQASRQLAQLQEPLLPAPAAAAAAEAGVGGAGVPSEQAWVAPYSMWRSKLFYCGMALLVLSVALGTLTVVTTLHPFPPE